LEKGGRGKFKKEIKTAKRDMPNKGMRPGKP
jgi:hypothetical protein